VSQATTVDIQRVSTGSVRITVNAGGGRRRVFTVPTRPLVEADEPSSLSNPD